jgi:hypothetical protein
MGQPVNLVAQYSMDAYYQQYRAASEFFDLEDFVFHIGATVADAFQQEYRTQYAELKQEKSDSVVAFDPSWLNEQILNVENKDGELVAILTNPVLNFAYDQSTVGIQNVFSVKPNPGVELERSTVNETWQYKYLPKTDRIFFRPERDKIKFFKNGNGNVNKIRVLYVPAIGENMEIPDGLVDYSIKTTVIKIRSLGDKNIVKKSLDGNQNKLIETEADKLQVK